MAALKTCETADTKKFDAKIAELTAQRARIDEIQAESITAARSMAFPEALIVKPPSEDDGDGVHWIARLLQLYQFENCERCPRSSLERTGAGIVKRAFDECMSLEGQDVPPDDDIIGGGPGGRRGRFEINCKHAKNSPFARTLRRRC